jgi:hypothetical protein
MRRNATTMVLTHFVIFPFRYLTQALTSQRNVGLITWARSDNVEWHGGWGERAVGTRAPIPPAAAAAHRPDLPGPHLHRAEWTK